MAPSTMDDCVVSPLTEMASPVSSTIDNTIAPPPYTQTQQIPSPGSDIEIPPEKIAAALTVNGDQYRPEPSGSTGLTVDYECFPEVVPEPNFPEAVQKAPQSANSGTVLPREYGESLPEPVPSAHNVYQPELNMSAAEAEGPTVTPLRLLNDEPDWVDCPFCQRRSKTDVKKKPSNVTHLQAVALLLTTVCGAAAPYLCRWSYDVAHHCRNCTRKVAYRSFTDKEMQVCATPEHMKEVSRYPAADGLAAGKSPSWR